MVKFSSPLLPRGVLGGRPPSLGGFIGREPLKDATARFSATLGPCCESLFRDHKNADDHFGRMEGTRSKRADEQTGTPTLASRAKSSQSPQVHVAYRHREVTKGQVGRKRPSSTRASFRRPSDSFQCSVLCSFSRRAARCRHPTSLQVQPCPATPTHRYRGKLSIAGFFELHRVVPPLCLLAVPCQQLIAILTYLHAASGRKGDKTRHVPRHFAVSPASSHRTLLEPSSHHHRPPAGRSIGSREETKRTPSRFAHGTPLPVPRPWYFATYWAPTAHSLLAVLRVDEVGS
jgi:hypothetical protein